MPVGVLLAVLLVSGPALQAQDTLSQAPMLVLDLFAAGGSSGSDVEVMLRPDGDRRIDLGSWARFGAATEVRLARRWSVQGSLCYALAGWESTGTPDPYGAHVDEGDRWELGAGVVWTVHRTPRSLFSLAAGARFFWGMDIRGQVQRDTLYNAYTFQSFRLNYKPGVDPVAGITWRWHTSRNTPFAILVSTGIEHYQVVFKDAEPGVSSTTVLEPLLPLTERRSGWAWVLKLGISVIG